MHVMIKLAPMLVALAMVASPSAQAQNHGRDFGRGHDRQGPTQSRGYDRRDDRNDRRAWGHDRVDRDRNGTPRHEHWNQRPSRVVYRPAPPRSGYRHPSRVVYQPAPRVRYGRPYHRAPVYHAPPRWARGRDYRSYGYNNVYYVPYNDYRRYDLYEPGYGQRWVRDDTGNFLLVAAATGIITSILLNHAY